MSNESKEMERLKRLREQQLKARDPKAKQRKINRRVAARRGKLKKQTSLSDMLNEIPYKWQGIFIGALFGLLIFIALPMFVEASWTDYAGLAAIVVLSIIGFFFGQAFDAREELKDLID